MLRTKVFGEFWEISKKVEQFFSIWSELRFEFSVSDGLRSYLAGQETVLLKANYAWRMAGPDRWVLLNVDRPEDIENEICIVINGEHDFWIAADGENNDALANTWQELNNHLKKTGMLWPPKSPNAPSQRAAIKHTNKRGPRRYSRSEKVTARKEWDAIDRDENPITLEEWLEQKFGAGPDGTLNVPKSTFYSWPNS